MNKAIPKQKTRFIAIVTLLLCISLTACSDIGSQLGIPQEDEIHIENGFVYYMPKKDTIAYLVGIQAEAGDENGLAVIPKEFNGRTVSNLGYQKKIEHWSGTYYKAELSIDESIKEVFIPSSVRSAENLTTNNGRFRFIVNCRIDDYPICPGLNGYDKIVFVYPEDCLWSENAYLKYKQSVINNAEVRTGNIYFNLNPNEDDEYCYWLDYLEAKGKIRRPKDPIREGYAFTGWYTEAECVNIWDFECEVELAYLKSENDVVNINNDGYRFSEETFDEYRNYIESVSSHKITLYAGWEQV